MDPNDFYRSRERGRIRAQRRNSKNRNRRKQKVFENNNVISDIKRNTKEFKLTAKNSNLDYYKPKVTNIDNARRGRYRYY